MTGESDATLVQDALELVRRYRHSMAWGDVEEMLRDDGWAPSLSVTIEALAAAVVRSAEAAGDGDAERERHEVSNPGADTCR